MTARLAALGAAIAVAAGSAAVADAAAPRLVLVSGASLESPVLLSDWGQIADFVGAVAAAQTTRGARVRGRPSLQLALFWGPVWDEYARPGRTLARLRPSQADQVGRFFPAWEGRPAAVELPWSGSWPRIVPRDGLVVLERNGIPTSVRDRDSRRSWWIGGAVAGVALTMVGVALLAGARGLTRVTQGPRSQPREEFRRTFDSEPPDPSG